MTDPSVFASGDFVIGPDYAPAPETEVRAGAPAGVVHAFTMESRDSAIYPGIRRLDNEITRRRDPFGNRIAAEDHEQSVAAPYTRTVWVYVPAQYQPGTAAPVIVAQDGYLYLNRLPRVLDNLIAEGRAPALIAILVDNGGGDAQGSQRGLEYDTVSGRYSDFIETEVLPRVVAETGVTLTDDPEGRATLGVSSGAACAFTMAWFHPERYRRVLSYSGTYVNQQSPPDPDCPRGAWEYHATLVPHAERKPLRIWMEVGDRDLHADDPEDSWRNWPLANQRMAAALAAKGYAYRFTLSQGGRHADPRVLEQTLPGALEWLWQDYPL
ncbi:esterase family protein [Phenylobacterium aquaticum]|uniref:alpha/beta hydrolase n=1 Tax=Phenylobacterium aquaticum TaxID=1763816 RepID=UPI0026F1576C|nr:alpha/beta hydrolase-fold protein [Phenylobacterium aquaticum]